MTFFPFPVGTGCSDREATPRFRRLLKATSVLAPLVVFLTVYGPAVGRGFISDDFGWIIQSRVQTASGVVEIFTENNGFYRPVVALTFAANFAIFGAEPLGYGWTNLVLALFSAALIVALLHTLGLGRAAAALGAGLWLLNFHGVNMALLWISGRTALLLIVGTLIATIAMLRGRVMFALSGLVFALFSKEEAVAVPVIWLSAYALDVAPRRRSRRQLATLAIGVVFVLSMYAILRTYSGAVTPVTAPSYYRFTLAPGGLARNLLEYADRACTFAAASALVGWLVLRPRRLELRKRLLLFGAVWIAAGYGITLWLPVRSSLYACLPSIGAALIAAAFLEACWRETTQRRRTWALVVATLIPIACMPAYVARAQRWTDLADLSAAVMRDAVSYAPAWADDTWLVFEDDRSRRANLQSAFGALIGDAVLLHTGRAFRVWVEPPLTYAVLAGMSPPCTTCLRARLVLRDGRLVQH